MAAVSMKSHYAVPAEKVWELIGGFNALADWHPAIEKSELEEGGEVRRLSLVGGGSIVETLEQMDEAGRLYRYRIVEGPLPVSGYVAQIRVTPDADGKGCEVEWSSEFAPLGASQTDAENVIRGIYEAGFDNLKKLFGG